jgi:hypothetical protein
MKKYKVVLDTTMTILMVFAFAYQLTDNLYHEVIGGLLFVLFIFHNILNRKWYKNLWVGRYSGFRIFSTIINVLILLSMIVLAGSSILISRDIFAFLDLKSGFEYRSIHTTAAQWALFFISVHLGLHWNMIMKTFGRNNILKGKKTLKTWILRGISGLVAIKGIYAFGILNIGSKLFMSSTFGYWNFKNHLVDFFISYFCIIGLYVIVTYYVVKLIIKK